MHTSRIGRIGRFFATAIVTACWAAVAAQEAPVGARIPEICFLDTGKDPMIALSWAELAPTGEPSTLRGNTLHLVATNRKRRDLVARISLHPLGNRRAPRISAWIETIPVGSTRTMSVGNRQPARRAWPRLRS